MSDAHDGVLIADDEESICFTLARLVKRRGLTPHVAADGRSAVETFRQHRNSIRAAFLDVRMPRLDGDRAIEELRAIDPSVPCCLMTAFTQEADVKGRLSDAAVPVLRKPFDLAVFSEMLGTMLTPSQRPRRFRVALAFPSRYLLWADVVRGVMRYARSGQNWLISVYQEENIAVALASEPDGVICMVWTEDAAEKLRAWGGPVVDTGPNFPNGTFARVGLADEEVGMVAAEHLLTLGPRHMAVITQPAYPALGRFKAGFIRRLASTGIACDVAPVEQFVWPTPISTPHLEGVMQWVASLSLPAAVFAVTDSLALRVSEACRESGLRIPEDVAILGALNDPVTCELGIPQLSSVRVAGEGVGMEAARVLDRMLRGSPAPAERIELSPVGVVVRKSTDTTAIADPVLATALRFLDEHLADPVSVEDVVEATAVSRSSLERRFRTSFGHGPLAELIRLRIERAKQLLVETDMTLGEIAVASGFPEARRLAVSFRQKTGTTPTKYRDSHRGT